MPIYSWGQDAPIEKLEITPFGKKGKEGVLFAPSGSAQGELAQIPEMLRSIGLTVVPDKIDNQYVLRVHGFDSDNALIQALEQNGFARSEQREKSEHAEDNPDRPKIGEWLRNNSLQAAGSIALIGDAALVTSGLLRKDMNETLTGVGYSSISAIHKRYGKKDIQKSFDDLYSEMMTEFAREGVELPDPNNVTSEDLGKPGGIISRIEEFLYQQPTTVTNAIGAFGGWQMFRAGQNQDNLGKKTAGALVIIGALTAILVPEKKRKNEYLEVLEDASQPWNKEEGDDKGGIFHKLTSPARDFAAWVQEKPLRFAGYLNMANNAFHGAGAMNEWRDNQTKMQSLRSQIDGLKSDDPDFATSASLEDLQSDFDDVYKGRHNWKFNILSSMAYMISNSLVSITSKNAEARLGDEESELDQIYAASASVLAAQPEEVRNDVVRKMAFHLAEQNDISDDPLEIESKIHAKINELAESPWQDRISSQSGDNDQPQFQR